MVQEACPYWNLCIYYRYINWQGNFSVIFSNGWPQLFDLRTSTTCWHCNLVFHFDQLMPLWWLRMNLSAVDWHYFSFIHGLTCVLIYQNQIVWPALPCQSPEIQLCNNRCSSFSSMVSFLHFWKWRLFFKWFPCQKGKIFMDLDIFAFYLWFWATATSSQAFSIYRR